MLNSFLDQKESQNLILSIPEPITLESSLAKKEKWMSEYIKWWNSNFEIKENDANNENDENDENYENYEDYEENSTD